MNTENAQGEKDTLQKSHRETPRCPCMNNSTGTTYSPHWITQDGQKQRIYVGKQPLNTSYRQGLVIEVQKAPLQTPNPHPTHGPDLFPSVFTVCFTALQLISIPDE